MAKFKLTKNELKKQKEQLKMFSRYLPTLQLKKQQLQLEIAKIKEQIKLVKTESSKLKDSVNKWIAIFGENVDFTELISIKDRVINEKNIAGVFVPIFQSIEFDRKNYDLFKKPFWLYKALNIIEQTIILKTKEEILNQQINLIKKELQSTSQKVNLFEKVKIPETKWIIKKITIYLGDEQTASVVRGKIAKRNIELKTNAENAEVVV